jgi:hypothetical protein
MLESAAFALAAFGLSFVALIGVEKLIHRWTYNPDRSYRWGVWLFSVLIAAYVYASGLGR